MWNEKPLKKQSEIKPSFCQNFFDWFGTVGPKQAEKFWELEHTKKINQSNRHKFCITNLDKNNEVTHLNLY